MAYRVEIIKIRTSDKIEILEKLNAEAFKGIQKACDPKCEEDVKHSATLREAATKHNVTNDMMMSPILRRMAAMYNKRYEANKKKGKQENEKERQERFRCKANGTAELGRQIKQNDVSPLLAVRRPAKGPNGQRKGTITTNPQTID